MCMSANLHNVTRATAHRNGATQWLDVQAKDGSSVGIFMPYEDAQAIADIINKAPAKAEAA
jgi:hypothetical protein